MKTMLLIAVGFNVVMRVGSVAQRPRPSPGQARAQTHRHFRKGNPQGNSTIVRNNKNNGEVAHRSTNCPCECPEGRAVLVVADSNSGSTWLGQILHRHPCSSSFIPPGQMPDGKFRPKDAEELTMMLWGMGRAAKGRSYGVILSPQYLARLLPEVLKAKRRGQPSSHALASHPVHVLVLVREPVFQAISFLKKAELLREKRSDGVECENVNQRGGRDCSAAAQVTISPKPRDLQRVVDVAKVTHAHALQHAFRVSEAFDGDVLEMAYADLLCTQAFRQGREGFLPLRVAAFTGLGEMCAAKGLSAVKASIPGSPAKSLRNLDAVKRFANNTSQDWEEALGRSTEALCGVQGVANIPTSPSSMISPVTESLLPARSYQVAQAPLSAPKDKLQTAAQSSLPLIDGDAQNQSESHHFRGMDEASSSTTDATSAGGLFDIINQGSLPSSPNSDPRNAKVAAKEGGEITAGDFFDILE